jgi:hypothetical protein
VIWQTAIVDGFQEASPHTESGLAINEDPTAERDKCHASKPMEMDMSPSRERLRLEERFEFMIIRLPPVLWTPSPAGRAGVRAKQNASRRKTYEARNQAEAENDPNKNPENIVRFRGLKSNQTRVEPCSFFHPDCYCRPGIARIMLPVTLPRTSLEILRHTLLVNDSLLVGFTTDREFTCTALYYLQCKCHPAPKVKYLIGVIITQLYFDDTLNRADRDALG